MSDESRQPGESFLAHRARLKAARQRAAATPAPLVPAETPGRSAREPAAADASPAAEAPPRPLTDADMPPIESLTAESDFSQFLAEGVSDALRRAALRKLFKLPEFGVLDGLNEYDEDYTQFEKLGNVVTYHQRRMRAREEAEKAAAERDAAKAAEADTSQAAAGSGDAPEVDAEEAVETEERAAAEPVDDLLEDDGDLQA